MYKLYSLDSCFRLLALISRMQDKSSFCIVQGHRQRISASKNEDYCTCATIITFVLYMRANQLYALASQLSPQLHVHVHAVCIKLAVVTTNKYKVIQIDILFLASSQALSPAPFQAKGGFRATWKPPSLLACYVRPSSILLLYNYIKKLVGGDQICQKKFYCPPFFAHQFRSPS